MLDLSTEVSAIGTLGLTGLTLGWTASTDNVGGTGVGGYYVYRSGNTTTPYATVTSGTAFLDSGLAAARLERR